jgi:hypothetical protein
MTSGGARARSGPPPDPTALRRSRDAGEWRTLPAEGRPGDPPEWPLLDQNEREAIVWERLWRKPQAVAWEEMGQEYEVAMHVRLLVEAEAPESSPAQRTVLLRSAEGLGLSIPGLARNKWRIGKAPQQAVVEQEAGPKRRPSARDRHMHSVK